MKTLCCILLSCALVIQAEEQNDDLYPLLKIGSKEFVNVRVLSVNPTGLKVIHDAGGGLIRFADLPAELQKKYGYDPAKAEAHEATMKAEQQQALAAIEKEKEAARAKDVAAAVPDAKKYAVSLKVEQVINGGALCSYSFIKRNEDPTRYSLGRYLSGDPRQWLVTKEAEHMIFVTGIPGLLADGFKTKGFITVTGTYTYEAVSTAQRTVYRCTYTLN